jgi:hypothetical protein
MGQYSAVWMADLRFTDHNYWPGKRTLVFGDRNSGLETRENLHFTPLTSLSETGYPKGFWHQK